ncbi:MAG: GDSL-type esterase/lipase family protein, partial [Planctomycetaceae bacterium]
MPLRTIRSILMLTILCLPALSSADEQPAKQAPIIKALQAEVQTAKWAQAWWMPRHKQKLKEVAQRKQIQLLMIGDSITHGWEGGGRKVWDEFYAQRNALNLGFSGDRTEQVLWRLQHGEVAGLDPKLAVIMIGTHTAGHRQDRPEHTAAGIKAIVSDLRKRMPKMQILLLGIFPRGQ